MNTITIKRAYQYRLYPNKGQADKLTWTLDRCRELYNAALEERREAYRMCGVSVTYDNMRKRPAPRPTGDGRYAPNGARAKAGLNKSMQDAAWGQFIAILTNKAEEAGSVVVAVNPAGTSQHCSGCGATVPKALAERRHECAACGLSLQRDVNAARNILHRAGLARAVV